MSMILINSNTLANNTTSQVNFTSIPQTYKLLYVTGSVRSTRPSQAWDVMQVRPNGLSSNLIAQGGINNGSTTITWSNLSDWRVYAPGSSQQIGVGWNAFTLWIGFYSSTSRQKPILINSNVMDVSSTSSFFLNQGGRWNVTNTAITSLLFEWTNGPYFDTGSRIDVYGVN